MTLDELGPRIVIMGLSNAGKSTLAVAIAGALGIPAVHLDQLHHQPGTDWVPRPFAEFAALHEAAIGQPAWVIEGNYTQLVPGRLARATGLILIDIPTRLALWRYMRRTLFERDRRGGLEGASERVKWEMIHHIAVVQRRHRQRYRAIHAAFPGPKLLCSTVRDLAAFYRANALTRRA